MSERHLSTREAEDKLEPLDSDLMLAEYLSSIAPFIGWVTIQFNALDDALSACLREIILRDPLQDERLDVFLSEMLFSAKCRALIQLYGQIISSSAIKCTMEDLIELEKSLLECSKRRNEYAHADWIGLKKDAYVRVKIHSKKQGIIHRYKKFELKQMEADIEYIRNTRDSLDVFNERLQDQIFGRGI